MLFHMSKEEVDNADFDHLMHIIPMSMNMFKHVLSNLSGNSNPGIGTGFSSSKVT